MSGDPIATMMPGCFSEDEERLRRRLLNARDISTEKATRLSPGQAHALSWMTVDLASAFVFRPVPLETLQAVADQCLRLMSAASASQYLEEECA